MRRKLIAVLLISVLSLSSFYAVSAEDDMIRGHKAETAYSAIIDKTIEGAIDTNNGTQYGVASASTRMLGGGYPGVILSVNMDVLDKATGHTLINGPKSDVSPAGVIWSVLVGFLSLLLQQLSFRRTMQVLKPFPCQSI